MKLNTKTHIGKTQLLLLNSMTSLDGNVVEMLLLPKEWVMLDGITSRLLIIKELILKCQ
jgi:hypothetical protein